MATILLSPNMNLPVPVAGQQSGPQYALNITSCMTLLDSHDHTSGAGVAIPAAGININSTLPMRNNNLTQVRSINFQAQGSPLSLVSDVGCIYESGVDLYYNDGLGNQVRITQGGGVAGTPGSISNLSPPASAAYDSFNGKFIWQQSAATSADMDFGSAIMRNDTVGSFALTLSPPTLSSNYSIILPTLPVSQKFMTLDASGNMSAPWSVDNSTLAISSNQVIVKALGITAAQIANATITTTQIAATTILRTNLAAVGEQISSSCGTFNLVGIVGFTDITNLTVTITTTGRPVVVGLVSNPAGGAAEFVVQNNSLGFNILRGATTVLFTQVGTAATNTIIPAILSQIDVVAAGTYTYKAQLRNNTGGTVSIQNAKLFAYEL